MKDGAGQRTALPGAAFAYHRAVAPMLWVLVAIATVEISVVHLLVALWSGRVALILSFISLGSLLWLLGFIRSLRRFPVIIGPDGLDWRCGSLRAMTVRQADVAAIRDDGWTLAAIKAAGCFNAALVAHPNIVIELRAPMMWRRRPIRYLAHRLDDPQTFRAAFDAWLESGTEAP